MFDERAFVARIESADVDELIHLLIRPTAQEEKVLRVHLGEDRYQRLHSMALRRSVSRGLRKSQGNVVVIHGIMGGELTATRRNGQRDQIWLKILRLISGQLDRLRLSEDGQHDFNPDYRVQATGILKREYGELLLWLSGIWNVHAFWFDWRKDLKNAADELKLKISTWFGDDAPVHIVAHSMGGLVSRTFIKRHPERWKTMWDRASNGRMGGRLVMLGTPNHGSFAIPQVITGLESTVRKLALIDFDHSLSELLKILNSFVGSYQMLPSPLVMASMEPLYKSQTYGDFNVPQRHLDSALRHHQWLSDVVDVERMIYIAGANQPTYSNIKNFQKLSSTESYEVTLAGDGRVPHQLGRLATSSGQVVTYYVEENHGALPANGGILDALQELLQTGSTRAAGLLDKPPAKRGKEDAKTRHALMIAAQASDEDRLRSLVSRLRTRNTGSKPISYLSSEERTIEELLTRGFLTDGDTAPEPVRETAPFSASIEIGLVCGSIQTIDSQTIPGPPVDAVSVGHYEGVKPQAAELALDKAISSALRSTSSSKRAELRDSDLLVSQFSQRGTIRGELGQLFILPDPRAAKQNRTSERVIAIAGMGVAGRFGEPELTVLVRELCWSLGEMNRRHLCTVVIGAGSGNIPVKVEISAWIRGFKHAITDAGQEQEKRLQRITFVEYDPDRIEDIQDTILEEKRRLEKDNRLKIHYQPVSDEEMAEIKKKRRRIKIPSEPKRSDDLDKPIPTRIAVALDRRTYRFGAITRDAAIPEREIKLDPTLVMQANDALAAEWEAAMQHERAQVLEKLLIPEELRARIYTDAPLVMMLDATTARIHWEMLAQSGVRAPVSDKNFNEAFNSEDYLGMSRGFTRQLRTTFAPPPDPPPPPQRILRVLIVADPAEDAHLPGAEEEGMEVADLFESFNSVYAGLTANRVKVVRLFGPVEATRINVLHELMMRSYDLLHFAGHCVYDQNDPASSGWVFTGGARLSANELSRIDRVPKFVFSNACESGVTPDRVEMRTAALAPSFAEAFFARGVSNFVCTAWPVDDMAARQFALRLYGGLLGLRKNDGRETGYRASELELMFLAMREARRATAAIPNGGRSWGAYQHYGNPYFQLFDPASMQQSGSAPPSEPRRRGSAAKTKSSKGRKT